MKDRPFADIFQTSPHLRDFFPAHNLALPGDADTPAQFFQKLPADRLIEIGADAETLLADFLHFAEQLAGLLIQETPIQSLEIIGGTNKLGEPENLTLRLAPGDVLSIVGPTGAGKSRLLEDIECLAQGDTPTGRFIRLDGREPTEDERFSVDNRLVAQLSQNMNFVVDLCVADFLMMHAESRMIETPHHTVQKIFETANRLAGEPFTQETSVTSLSGGQSRALMIADTACLSRSPVVLIDEIENAGVDRNLALDLLVQEEKIVLLVTHDPELALSAPRRIVIKNGGIDRLIDRSDDELVLLDRLSEQSRRHQQLRNAMRTGQQLSV